MNSQLSLFQYPVRRRTRGNPYRKQNGKYCTQTQYEQALKEAELDKLRSRAAFLERQVEMYERMALAAAKRLTDKERGKDDNSR